MFVMLNKVFQAVLDSQHTSSICPHARGTRQTPRCSHCTLSAPVHCPKGFKFFSLRGQGTLNYGPKLTDIVFVWFWKTKKVSARI